MRPLPVVRATRLRQNYPFLLLSQALREAGDIETLSSDSVLDELDGLLGLFLSRDLENRGLDSDEALLEKMRVYESYRAAESAYSRSFRAAASLHVLPPPPRSPTGRPLPKAGAIPTFTKTRRSTG